MAKEEPLSKPQTPADEQAHTFRLDRGESIPMPPLATDATDKPAKAARKRASANANAAAEVNATDAARDLADENEVDITTVKGTGADGRITVGDVQSAIDERGE